MPEQNVIQDFLNSLFGQLPDSAWVLLWTLPEKNSFWHNDIPTASDTAHRLAVQGKDVYVGVGLRPRRLGLRERGGSNVVSGLVGLWADIDIQDPVHKKKSLAPDTASVVEFLQPLSPTWIIHSGHGVQAWWLFDKPWLFGSEQERGEGQQLATQWHTHVRTLAQERGWDVDATQDLARVMRVPGTMNCKSTPVPVRVLESNNKRMTVKQAKAKVAHIKVKDIERPAVAEGDGELELDANANPPFDKWAALRDYDAKVSLSWERKREDLVDQTGSSYDLSLATFAAMASWSDQEIVDLLISARRHHGDDLKLRQDYYRRTLTKAREGAAKFQSQQAVHELSLADADELNEEGKIKLLGHLSTTLGVPITRVIKYMSDPPTYRLETGVGSIMLGDVDGLIVQTALRSKVAAATGRYIPKYKRWDEVAQGLLNVCEEISVGEEATDIGTARGWLMSYLAVHPPGEASPGTFDQMYPFVKDGTAYIFGYHFRKWLAISQRENVSSKQMGALLNLFGCANRVMAVTQANGKPSTRSVWELPQEITPKTVKRGKEDA